MKNFFSPKVLVLLFFLFFGGFYSCCEDPTPLYFEPKSIISSHMNNEGAYPVSTSSNQIPAIAYVLQARIEMGNKSFVDIYPQSRRGFQIGMSARAEGCYDYIQINEHRVEGWDIFSLNGFDATHPAGSRLTDYFELYSSDGVYKELTSQDALMQFALYAIPDQSEQQFVVDIYFNDNIVVRDTTEVVWLD